MSSNYQMYMQLGVTFRFPVLPEQITVSYGSNNDNLRVCGVGDVTIIQDPKAANVSFSCFFPATWFSGCDFEDIPKPFDAVGVISWMIAQGKPIRFTITGGIGISMYCTVESFETHEESGDVGSIYYSLKLKEYREVTARQIHVDVSARKATVQNSASRVNNNPAVTTYEVQPKDCLWNLAIRFYGKNQGSKCTIIYNANKEVIEAEARKHKYSSSNNGRWIFPGTVLSIPAA